MDAKDAKERKRKAIADAARELFAEFGYRSVSMEQIAQRASVAKGTVYLYFKDKAELFDALAQELLEGLQTVIRTYENKKISFFDEVHGIVYNLLMYRRSQRFFYKAAQEAKEFHTPAAVGVVEMFDKTVTGYLESRLRGAMEEGIIKPCNPSVLSFVIIRVYTALAFEWEETHEPLNERDIAENVRMFLTEGLRAQPVT